VEQGPGEAIARVGRVPHGDEEIEGRGRLDERHQAPSWISTRPSFRPRRKTMNSAGAASAPPTSQTSWPSRIESGGLFEESQRTKNDVSCVSPAKAPA